jgi:hypothetical protein
MKHALYLLALVTSQCISCELASIEVMRKDVEAAFAAKSFTDLLAKYGESQSVEVKLEDEYEEENPVTVLKFSGIGELARWFHEKHQHTEHMFVPEPVVCRDFGGGFGCEYELPTLTLHHGKYLLGFKARREGQCTLLAQVFIYWG